MTIEESLAKICKKHKIKLTSIANVDLMLKLLSCVPDTMKDTTNKKCINNLLDVRNVLKGKQYERKTSSSNKKRF